MRGSLVLIVRAGRGSARAWGVGMGERGSRVLSRSDVRMYRGGVIEDMGVLIEC